MQSSLFGRGKRSRSSAVRFYPHAEILEERAVPSATPTSWDQRGIGGGGSLFSPSINPNNPSEIYVSSDMSQLFHTTDGGASWETVSHQEIQGNRRAEIQFTNDPNILYSLDYTNVNGLDLVRPSKSTDGGTTWTPLSADPTSGEAFTLKANPNNHQVLFVTDYRRLYVSTDGGASFALKYTTNDGNGLHIGGAFFDGNNIFIGTNQGVLLSSNGGNTFSTMATTGMPGNERIVSFAGGKENGTTRFFAVTMGQGDVYAGVGGDDYYGYESVYSLDVGVNTWTQRVNGIETGSYPSDDFPVFVAMAPDEIDIAYLGGGSEISDPVIYRTSNAGQSWTNVFQTINNQNIETGWSGYQGDRGWGYGELVFGLTVNPSDPNQVIFTDYGFAHETTDGGQTWKALYVDPSDLNPAGAATPKGQNYASSGLDNTSNWQVFWVDSNTMLVANADIRSQRSTDGGQTWAFNHNGLPSGTNSVNRYSMNSTGTVFAATSSVHDLYQSTYLLDSRIDGADGTVIYSTDGGASWQLMHDFNNAVIWVEADPTNPDRVYASVIHSTQGGIYVTNNASAGANSIWTKLTNPPRTEGHPFNIVILDDGSLVVSYSARRNGSGTFTESSGVFLSSDGGLTWQDRTDPGMRFWTKDIIIDPHDANQNTWYAGVWSGWGGPPNGLGGLYKTTNRGQSWTRINSLDRVSSLTINPNDADDAYLTTEVNGLWHTENLNSATPTFTLVENYPFRQPERVSFNPHNPDEIWVNNFGNGLFVGEIPDDGSPQPGQLQLSATNYSALEHEGQIIVTITRIGGSDGAVSVNYATTDGSATAGSDYTATNGVLNFADGETSKTVSIPILDDSIFEGPESLQFSLSNVSGGATLGTPINATVTIEENDSHPTPGEVVFSSSSYSVGENGGQVVITVSRINGSDGAVSVDFATANGSATAGSDYVATNGTLTFASGETSKTFAITIIDDSIFENSETVNLSLSNATGGATLGIPNSAVLTINDDDVQPQPGQIQLSSANYSAAENEGLIVVTVNRVGGSDGAVSVNYATTNGSATAGSDYTSTSGVLTFASGETSKTISVPIFDDSVYEGPETLQLTLSGPGGGATLGTPSSATLTIEDNDPQPVPGEFVFSSGNYSVGESGGQVVITVSRINGSDGTVSVDYATANGSATAGSDYVTTNGTLTFANGETSKTFAITIIDDSIFENSETVNLSLSNATGGATLGNPNSAVLTINDDDVQPQPGQLQLSDNQYSAVEHEGSIVVTVNRVGGSDGTVSVNYSTTNGSATAGSDYTVTNGMLTFANGETSKTISVPIFDDSVYEGPETLQLTLSGPGGGATLGTPSSATLTIEDNDPVPPPPQVPTFTLSHPTYTVNEGDGALVVTVQRLGDTSAPGSVWLYTRDGAEFVDWNLFAYAGQDYGYTEVQVNFAAGESAQTVNIPMIDNSRAEIDEIFRVKLTQPSQGSELGDVTTSIVTITDNETSVEVGNWMFRFNEGDAVAEIVVVRKGDLSGTSTVDYHTHQGSAKLNSDFLAVSGGLTFAPGEAEKIVAVPIVDDVVMENEEYFGVSLSNVNGAYLGRAWAYVYVADDDLAANPGTFNFAGASYSVNEDAGILEVTVERVGGSDGEVSVGFSTYDGDIASPYSEYAWAYSDYGRTRGTLTFADGETSKTIQIPIYNDSRVEADEKFRVKLFNPSGGAWLGDVTQTLVTIRESLSAFAFSTPDGFSVSESDGVLLVTVTRLGNTSESASVDFRTYDRNAYQGSDYVATNGQLLFAPGETSKTIAVTIIDDVFAEGDEGLGILLENEVNAVICDRWGKFTITDDDA